MVQKNIAHIESIARMESDKLAHPQKHLIGFQPIIRPQKIDILARRPPYPLIHRVVNPLIRLADPVGNLLLILSYDLHRAIRRPAIDDDIFDARILLLDHAQNRLLDGGGSVV